MLWLALYFPQLPIDRQQCADVIVDNHDGNSPVEGSPDTPRAVVLNEGTRRRVLACNASATAAGVRAGMALKNAYALVPDLLANDYDEAAQRDHLEQLALWALPNPQIGGLALHHLLRTNPRTLEVGTRQPGCASNRAHL